MFQLDKQSMKAFQVYRCNYLLDTLYIRPHVCRCTFQEDIKYRTHFLTYCSCLHSNPCNLRYRPRLCFGCMFRLDNWCKYRIELQCHMYLQDMQYMLFHRLNCNLLQNTWYMSCSRSLLNSILLDMGYNVTILDRYYTFLKDMRFAYFRQYTRSQ